MKLAEVQQWFQQHGMPFAWRTEGKKKRPAILRPPANHPLPLGSVKVGIVIPDVHLGVGNDPFTFGDVTRAHRLEAFLDRLALLRDQLGAGAFTAVQLGDFYDLMRAPLPTCDAQRAAIQAQYPGVFSRAAKLPLRYCLGNHDSGLVADLPPVDVADYGIARPVGTNAILCFHGHDPVTLHSVQVIGFWAKAGVQTLNLINTLPVLGTFTSWLQTFADASFEDPWLGNGVDKPWKPAKLAGPKGWNAPWIARGKAEEIGEVIRGAEAALGTKVEVALIGHSHRPGIGWAPVTATRRVALVDAGSWTYGRAEFAVVCSDGIGLAAFPRHP